MISRMSFLELGIHGKKSGGNPKSGSNPAISPNLVSIKKIEVVFEF